MAGTDPLLSINHFNTGHIGQTSTPGWAGLVHDTTYPDRGQLFIPQNFKKRSIQSPRVMHMSLVCRSLPPAFLTVHTGRRTFRTFGTPVLREGLDKTKSSSLASLCPLYLPRGGKLRSSHLMGLPRQTLGRLGAEPGGELPSHVGGATLFQQSSSVDTEGLRAVEFLLRLPVRRKEVCLPACSRLIWDSNLPTVGLPYASMAYPEVLGWVHGQDERSQRAAEGVMEIGRRCTSPRRIRPWRIGRQMCGE